MVSVVVPIYNEEELILQFHAAVANAMQSVVEEWEVVYVNDGSTDSSLELLKGLQSLDSHVVVAELSRNWGHPGAVSAGLRTASGRAVIVMDGDFQDPPEVLPQLIDAWRSGAEVVVGQAADVAQGPAGDLELEVVLGDLVGRLLVADRRLDRGNSRAGRLDRVESLVERLYRRLPEVGEGLLRLPEGGQYGAAQTECARSSAIDRDRAIGVYEDILTNLSKIGDQVRIRNACRLRPGSRRFDA